MRPLSFFLLMILAVPANAQTVASDYYTQCTGAAFEMQARRQYEALRCQLDDSCDEFDPAQHAATVEAQCFAKAIDICGIFEGSDRCINGLIVRFNERTSLVETEFSQQRAQNARLIAEGLTLRRLERHLQSEANGSPAQCVDVGAIREFERSTGAKRETICAIFQAVTRNARAYDLRRLILRVEGQDR